MKNVYLYILFLLIGGKSLGQGVDVLFLLDGSGSVGGYPSGALPPTGTEYRYMHDFVQETMAEVLECNPNNRVAVAQYHDLGIGEHLYIDADFTNLASSFIRHGFGDDRLYLFLDEISNALSGVADPEIYGISSINRTPGNSLVVYIITDAERDGIINASLNTATRFSAFDDFKNNYDATIMVALIGTGSSVKEAAAAVASVGGAYMGEIENYPTSTTVMVTPRFFFSKSSYSLLSEEIEMVSADICELGKAPCESYLVLISPDDDALNGYQDHHQSSNIITASNIVDDESVGIYHGENTVVLSSGFHSDGGSVFRAYIDGCSDTFYGRENMYMEEDPRGKEVKGLTLFSLAPNPATESVSIKSNKVMATITVTSMQGVVLFNRDVKANSYDLNISNYIKGFYVVNVTTEEGQTETQKLIKE